MGTTTLTRPRAKACCVFVALLLQVMPTPNRTAPS